jgi:TonB-linked SusC/RagA family outer membrane protein
MIVKYAFKKGKRLSFVIMLFLSLFMINEVSAQSGTTISGVVKDDTGFPLPGVNIIEKGTKNTASSDMDGKFKMKLTTEKAVITVSYIGFETQSVSAAGKSVVNVTLKSSAETLGEVKIVSYGYGTIKKDNLVGSVSSISGKELAKMPVTNVAEALSGRLAGVSVKTVDGAPGSDIVIRVRGGGSVTQDNSPLYVVDGFIVSNINDIPPTDILSIDVLKDAATTAIYGAQASNGVVVITTKKPKAGKTTINYNHYSQFNTLPAYKRMDVLSPYEFVTMQYETARLKDGVTSGATVKSFEKFFGKYDDLELYKYKKANDWQDDVFGNGSISYFNNLSITGGSETTKFSLSLSSNKDEGLIEGSGLNRNVVNFKLNHDISKTLKLDLSARITDRIVNGGGTSGSSQLRIKNIVTARPTNGIADELDLDEANNDGSDDYQEFLLSLVNPSELVKQDWRKNSENNYVFNAGLGWDVLSNLNAKSVISTSNTYGEKLRFYGPKTSVSQQEGSSLPLGVKDDYRNFSYRWTNTLNYDFKNIGEHQLGILVGQEMYSIGGKSSHVRAEEFRASITPEEMFAAMQLGKIVEYSTFQNTEENRFSLFGRANYSYKDKYLFTATVRQDASSKFSKENRVGIFPAFAAGWKISSEPFLKDSKMINELKLRVSYGATGNDRIPANSTDLIFQAGTDNGPGFGSNAYNTYYNVSGSTLYNPDLVWETTINRNIGLDFKFFNSKLSGSFDVYRNTTEDLLLASAISPVSGFNNQWDNIGSTSNQGAELSLNAYLIDKDDFTLSANFNIGTNKSKIDALDGTTERFIQSNWASTDLKDRDDYYLAVGQSVGLIYGYVNDGMYTTDDFDSYDAVTGKYALKTGVVDNKGTIGVASVKPGYMKLKDLNADGVIDSKDRKVIGDANPTAQGGFGLSGTFKSFDFSAFFNWSLGNDVYNTGKMDYNQLYRTTYGNMLNTMNSADRFTYIDADGAYTGVAGGVVTDLAQLAEMNKNKSIWSGNNSFGTATAVVTDWAIEDASYLRLNNVTIGYTLPMKDMKKAPISNLRLYVTGSNLWLLTKYTGYDPDVNSTRSDGFAALTPGLDYSSYPKSVAFTFGLNVTF